MLFNLVIQFPGDSKLPPLIALDPDGQRNLEYLLKVLIAQGLAHTPLPSSEVELPIESDSTEEEDQS